MFLLSALDAWPDRTMPIRHTHGYTVTGFIESSGLFGQFDGIAESERKACEEFLGDGAVDIIHVLEASARPSETLAVHIRTRQE